MDYHPAFPYSVFLGHNGAQFNLPQMYWHDIGTSVDGVYRHTYMVNSIYRRWICPLGQRFTGPTSPSKGTSARGGASDPPSCSPSGVKSGNVGRSIGSHSYRPQVVLATPRHDGQADRGRSVE